MKKPFCNVVALGLATIPLAAMAGPVLDSYWPLNNGDQKTFAVAKVVPATLSVSNPGNDQFNISENFSGSTVSLLLEEDANDSYLTGVNDGGISVSVDPVVPLLNDDILQNGGTVKTSTTVSQQGVSYPATFTIKIGKAGTVTVPAGTFSNCRSLTSSERAVVPGRGVVTASALTAVLAPGVGIIKTQIVPGMWAELVSGTIAGVPIGQQNIAEFTLEINGGGAVQIKGINGLVEGTDNVRLLQIGQTYTMTAKSKDGAVFSDWVSNTNNSLGTIPQLTFTMQSNLVLQANFIPNPFADAAGKYIGLFMPGQSNTAQNSGFVSVVVTTKGTFSGYLQAGNARRSFSGQFDANGNFTNTINFLDDSTVTVGLHLTVPGGTYLTGTLADGNWTAQLNANELISGKVAFTQTGRYSVIFAGSNDNSAGSAVMNFTKSGPTTLAGKLGDGTKFSASSTFTPNGVGTAADWPFYTSLYGGKGCFFGWMDLGPSEVVGNFIWIQSDGNVVSIQASGQLE